LAEERSKVARDSSNRTSRGVERIEMHSNLGHVGLFFAQSQRGKLLGIWDNDRSAVQNLESDLQVTMLQGYRTKNRIVENDNGTR